MSRIVTLAALPLAALAAGVAADPAIPAGPLTLVCTGLATNPVGDPARGATGNRKGNRSRTATKADDADRGVDTPPSAPAGRGTPVEFRFAFDGDHGRVLYPLAIIPVVHSGGRDGWWPIGDLAVSDDAFSGRVTLNFVNHARFTIDRHTGLFNLTGLQADVTGRCTRAEAGPRLF